jgi:lipopolysaccharide export system protein LptA
MNKIPFFLLVFVGFYSGLGMALVNDSDQPITIDSNSAVYDEKKGVSIYYGNVISIQGSLRVNSDKLVAYLRDGDVVKLVWTGKPARFKQKPEGGKEEIHGKALTLEYYPDKALFILIKEAVVTQGTNTYKSDLIKYDTRNSVVKAGERNTDNNRVRVILKPKKKQSNTTK